MLLGSLFKQFVLSLSLKVQGTSRKFPSKPTVKRSEKYKNKAGPKKRERERRSDRKLEDHQYFDVDLGETEILLTEERGGLQGKD